MPCRKMSVLRSILWSMEITKKFWLLFLSFLFQLYQLKAEPISIQIESRRDYEILDQFFRMEFYEEEYGYVLEGVKPISIRNFYALDNFPVAKDLNHAKKEFSNGLLVREAIPIWNKLCSHQKNFVLKAIPIKDPESVTPSWEVQFINISKLKEVIDKNIDLFRYALGPAIETEQLVDKIAHSKDSLTDILRNDLTLTGIVLGFGSYNSLVGGRIETIGAHVISRDCAPFSSKSLLMQSQSNHSLCFLTPQCYGGYYLGYAGGDDTFFRSSFSSLQPSLSYTNVEEELSVLDAMHEPIPLSLNQRPGFVFGASKGGPSNQPFFECLQQVQKQIQALLKKSDFLEHILKKIGGKKPIITCDKSAFSGSIFSLFQNNTDSQEWVRILRSVANGFADKEAQLAFFEAFRYPSTSSREAPIMVGASKAIFEGLKKALHNLAAANTHFETLSKDNSLKAIVPKQLYFKITLIGSGKKLKGDYRNNLKNREFDQKAPENFCSARATIAERQGASESKNSEVGPTESKTDSLSCFGISRVRMGYVVEDPQGNVLFANHDAWLDLSQTIPGFAHGVQGMQVGEKRTLFIHPALAYGALTTLPPCIELIVKVHLLGIDEASSEALPDLTSRDLSWVQDPSFYQTIEKSIEQRPRFIGTFYRDMLDKIEGLDKTALIAQLDNQDASD